MKLFRKAWELFRKAWTVPTTRSLRFFGDFYIPSDRYDCFGTILANF